MSTKPIYTKHFRERMNQRGITKEMIDIVFRFGEITGDTIILSKRLISDLMSENTACKSILLKILDKGGICLIFKDNRLITIYHCKGKRK